MNKPGKYIGFWWLPNVNKLQEVPGILDVTREHITLTTTGIFPSISRSLRSFEQDIVPIICGQGKFEDGNVDVEFSLFDCQIMKVERQMLTKVVIRAGGVVQGEIFNERKGIKIGTLFTKLQLFDDWVSVSGFYDRDSSVEEGKESSCYTASLHYKKPDLPYLYQRNGLKVSVYARASKNNPVGSNYVGSIMQSMFLNFEFSKPRTLDSSLKVVDSFKNLFSLLIGQPLRILNLEYYKRTASFLKKNPNLDRELLKLNIREVANFFRKDFLREESMIIPYSIFKNDSQIIMEAWERNYEILSPSLKLYFDNIHSVSLYPQNRLLNFVFAIEIFHKSIYPDFIGKDIAFQKKLNSITKNMKQNDKEWILKRLKNKNERTLLNRFNDLYNQNSDLFKLIAKKPTTFIKKVVSTRNYYAHHGNNYKNLVIKDVELNKYNKKLELILNYLFLLHIGVAKDVLFERINNPPDYRVSIRTK